MDGRGPEPDGDVEHWKEKALRLEDACERLACERTEALRRSADWRARLERLEWLTGDRIDDPPSEEERDEAAGREEAARWRA